MVAPRRAPDGRFVPRTGEVVLPPKPQQPRDEHGHFIPKDKVTSSKPYSRAVREALEANEGEMPGTWNRQKLSEAQALALVHIAMAKSGNVQVGMMLIDRAEGKVPQAAEDREADLAKGQGLKILADLLGITKPTVPQAHLAVETEVLDSEIVPQSEDVIVPQLPAVVEVNTVPQTDDGSASDSTSSS